MGLREAGVDDEPWRGCRTFCAAIELDTDKRYAFTSLSRVDRAGGDGDFSPQQIKSG